MKQSLSARRGRLLVRSLMIALVLAASAAIFASPAAAAEPTKRPYSGVASNSITGVCSFTFDVSSIMRGTEIDYFDKSGALTRIFAHQVEQDTFTANGKTLVGIPFTFNMEILFKNGSLKNLFADGVVEKIPLPDGSLFISAGRVDFAAHPGATYLLSPDKGNPGNVAGFCAALSE